MNWFSNGLGISASGVFWRTSAQCKVLGKSRESAETSWFYLEKSVCLIKLLLIQNNFWGQKVTVGESLTVYVWVPK